MPTRIDVELTSARPDGTWTWRAAGAKEPRGVVESSLLPNGAKVGDVFKVEATVALDGIEIHSIVPNRPNRKEPERLEILGGGDFQGVTTSLVGRRDRDDRGRRDRDDSRRGPRRDGKQGERSSGDRGRGDHRRDERGAPGTEGGPAGGGASRRPPRERRERPSFAPVPEVPQRPKPKRLKPGRAHRQELLAALPESHRPIADQLFRGGLPSVRQALQDQNDTLRAEGKPAIATTGIEALAQDLLPQVRVADWLDRADAALVVVDDLDLRDLRSVVTAAADPVVGRDDNTRDLSAQLRDALDRRQNEEYDNWLADITLALDVGRVVRALRLSSRPPKAGVPFPPELGNRLTESATAALTADAASDRWAAVIEALAFSPVHALVTPAAPPSQVTDELRAVVKGVGSAVPQIASLLDVEVAPPGRRAGRSPRLPRRPTSAKPRSGPRPVPPPPTTARTSAPPAAEPAAATEVVTAPPAEPQALEPATAAAESGTAPPAESGPVDAQPAEPSDAGPADAAPVEAVTVAPVTPVAHGDELRAVPIADAEPAQPSADAEAVAPEPVTLPPEDTSANDASPGDNSPVDAPPDESRAVAVAPDPLERDAGTEPATAAPEPGPSVRADDADQDA